MLISMFSPLSNGLGCDASDAWNVDSERLCPWALSLARLCIPRLGCVSVSVLFLVPPCRTLLSTLNKPSRTRTEQAGGGDEESRPQSVLNSRDGSSAISGLESRGILCMIDGAHAKRDTGGGDEES